MECEICLRSTDECDEIIRVRGGVYLCRECKDINDELDEDMAYVDEALMEMTAWEVDDED